MTTQAVLYTRVCVDDGQNLTEQLEACRRYAQQHGLQVVEELAERSAGGSTAERPHLSRVLEMARAGDLSILIVREPNRLSRDLAELLAIEAKVQKHGVEIVYTVPEQLDGSAASLLQAVLAGLPAIPRRRRPRGRKDAGR